MAGSTRMGEQVVNIFIEHKCQEMPVSTFSKLWKKRGHQLDTSELCALPYINIDNKQPAFIRLVIEQEDCIDHPSPDNLKCYIADESVFCAEFELTGLCTNDACVHLHRPNVKLMDRLIDCFTLSGKETLSLVELQNYHHESFPQFDSHVPSLQAICSRYPDQFVRDGSSITWKDYNSLNEGEFNLLDLPSSLPTTPKPLQMNFYEPTPQIKQHRRKQAIVPEQTDMYKIFFAINSEWKDKSLVQDLLKYFRHLAPNVVPQDLYIPRRHRSGFLSFQNSSDAQQFIQSTWMSHMKCGGRTIYARMWQDRDSNKNRIRVKIQNISLCVSYPQFTAWCYANIATKESKKIYDLQIINNVVNKGADYAILCVNSKEEGQELMAAVQRKQFRNRELNLSEWVHPDTLANKSKSRSQSFSGYLPAPGLSNNQKTNSRLRHRHSFPSKRVQQIPTQFVRGRESSSWDHSSTSSRMIEWDLQSWLSEDVRCGQYLDAFVKHGLDNLDAMDPHYITDQVLQNIGVQKVGDRIKILKAIRNLHL